MWLLLVLLLLCASFGGSGARDESDDDGVRFLLSRHSLASWARLQAELDDLYSAGKWIHPNVSSPSSSSSSPASELRPGHWQWRRLGRTRGRRGA